MAHHVFAGRTVNYKGKPVIAIHVPDRKYRILLTPSQYTAMHGYFFSGRKIYDQKNYAALRKKK